MPFFVPQITREVGGVGGYTPAMGHSRTTLSATTLDQSQQPLEAALTTASGGQPPRRMASEETRRVLVVEDNPHVSDMLRYSLGRLAEKRGAPGSILVAQANDGAEAVVALQHDRYDLVITDMYMPVMDGEALLDWVRDHQAHVPVIVVSAGGPDARATAERKGAKCYLAKPVRLADILHHVESALDLSVRATN